MEQTAMSDRSKKFQLLVFFIIASAIPFAILVSIALLPEFYDWWYGRPFAYEVAVLEAAQQLGYDFVSTNLIERVPGVMLEPVLSIALIYAAAPTIAAVIVILAMSNKAAWQDFVGRYNPFRQSQSHKRTLLLYGSLVAVSLAIRVPVVMIGGLDTIDFSDVVSITALYTLAAYALVDQGGLLEEGGWRAFALPYLLDKMKTPLRASIFLGLVWSFWHIPRDLLSWDRTALDFIVEYGVFTFGTVTTSIVITYFFNVLGGSVWPAIIFH
ncbi:MAG: CPBP family glutamic-type intramembrane protease, partial [Kordiimonas sp.]